MTKKRRTAPRPPAAGRAGPQRPSTDRVRSGSIGSRSAPTPGRRPIQTLLLVGVAVIAAIAAITAVVLAQGTGSSGLAALRSPTVRPGSAGATLNPIGGSVSSHVPGQNSAPTIAGVRCDPTEQITFHVHAHLNIRIGGQLETIPGDVGQRATCIYWLHTHAAHGVIHIEAPGPTAFTLGQFFDVWGKPLDGTHVGDWAVPSGSSIWVFIDGKQVTVDPRSIELKDLESIELQVGPQPIDPLPYTFPADFS